MVSTRRMNSKTLSRFNSLIGMEFAPAEDIAVEAFDELYEAKEVLGKGLSSVVRRCVNRETGEVYAVKIVDKTLDKSLEACVRTEIEILEHVLPHDYIIKLHEWFETSVYFFLVFELAQKGELFDQLTQAVRFSETRSKCIMLQLLCALDHLHSLQIVHRDVKPENILLDSQFNVRLSDMGFAARLTPEKPCLRDLCGTPGYMAPETLNCATFDNAPGYGLAVDMWACGVILYTMLVGFPPFWHRKQLAMLRMIRSGKYNFDAPEWCDISEVPKDLIRRLLVVNPAQRLTVDEALAHPFLMDSNSTEVLQGKKEEVEDKVEEIDTRVETGTPAVRLETPDLKPGHVRFARVVKAVLASSRLRIKSTSEEPMPTVKTIPNVPYDSRRVRCVMDSAAFRVYGHWVKKGDQQNRAAMFENEPKCIAMRMQSRVNSAMQSRSNSPQSAV